MPILHCKPDFYTAKAHFLIIPLLCIKLGMIISIMEMYEKTPDIDGVFISCTNSRTIELIDVMEKKLGIPVFSSNQVSLFSALKLIGYKGHVKGYGSLFDML